MLTTSHAFRIALTAGALLSASAATAGAKPRRVVILDFDGPRGLADSGREEVVTLLGEQYDIVATVARDAAPGDLVIVMSNGGFDDIHRKLTSALEDRGAHEAR